MQTLIRAARPSDKIPLMEFIKDVWGGHDYIPYVWDDWIRDRSAKMFVLEADGKPVGLNRIRFPEDGSAWFEGVRVHPDYRGHGLATMLGENGMEVAARRGARTFRLTSNSRNKQAHRQIARMRFKEVARFSIYDLSKRAKLRHRIELDPVGPGQLRTATRAIHRTKEFRLASGVMWDVFSAASLTSDVIASQVRQRSLYLHHGAVAILRPGKEGKQTWKQISFVGGDPGAAAELVTQLLLRDGRADWRFAYVAQGSPMIPELKKAGMKRSFSHILYERKAAKG